MKNIRWNRLAVAVLLVAGNALAIPEGPEPNTPEWLQRELANYARTVEAPLEQVTNPVFMQRFTEQGLANQLEWSERGLSDPSWLLVPSLNTLVTPLCTTWAMQCVGDPFRYPGVDPFYESDGEVTPFVYYDEGCARISGRMWTPKGAAAGARLPGVVIENGSIQAPEPLYWWMAQALVRAGYVVMTFDPRGQGRSDQATPTGEQGSNFNSAVFFDGLVNAIDFFRSTPALPYPHNESCAGTYPTEVVAFNPYYDRLDPARLGLAGHSLGAAGVSEVQGYEGARFQFPDAAGGNPVDVIVAWDSLRANNPRVPAMGHTSEYGIGGVAFLQPPDPDEHKSAFEEYRAAGLPVFQLTIQGSTHFEWSLIPTFPATSWCPDTSSGQCTGGWGRPLAEHYSLAWFDRWLKQPGETGYADADARLLADDDWRERYSFYFRSARSFADRGGRAHLCEDIRAGCTDTGVAPPGGPRGGSGGVDLGDGSGGGCTVGPAGSRGALELLWLAAFALVALAVRRAPARLPRG